MRQAKRPIQCISTIQAAEHYSCLRSLIYGPGHSCRRRAFVTVGVEYRFGGQRRDCIGHERRSFPVTRYFPLAPEPLTPVSVREFEIVFCEFVA
jgi:hypothetical protein